MRPAELQLLWEAYSTGFAGPMKDYTIAYTLLCSNHNIAQMIKLVNSKKGTKADKVPSFKEMFPLLDTTTDSVSEEDKQFEMAKKAAFAMGMPAEIYERLTNDSTNVHDNGSG